MTYYPGWKFSVTETVEGPRLRILTRLPDSYNPNETVDLGIDSHLPPMPDEDYLKTWILDRLKRIAIHETCEWLRVDGKLVLDPHAEESQTNT